MLKWRVIVGCVLPLPVAFAAAARAADGEKIQINSQEVHLVAPRHVIVKWPFFSDGLIGSPDSRHIAYVAKQGGQQLVVRDGVECKPYDWIASQPIFSPDSRRLLYIAGTVSRGKLSWRVVVDGVEGKSYDSVVWYTTPKLPSPFSPDSKRVAYIALRDARPADSRAALGSAFALTTNGYLVTCEHVVRHAGVIQVTFADKTYAAELVASDSAADLALLKIDAQNFPALPLGDSDRVDTGDDANVLGYPQPLPPGAAPRIKRGVVSGRTVNRFGQKLIQTDAVINPGNSGGPLVNERGEVVGVVNAKLAGPGIAKVGFAIPSSNLRKMLRDHRVEPETAPNAARIDAAALSKKIAPAVGLVSVLDEFQMGLFSGHANAKQFVVVDGVEGSEYGEIFANSLTFSQDGSRFGYATCTAGNCRLVVDGAEMPFRAGGELARPRPYFSPDGSRLAFCAWDRECFAVVDGKRQAGRYDEIGTFLSGKDGGLPVHVAFVFSPDGKRLAYIARRGRRQLVVLDGTEGKEYDEIHSLVFSPDSKRLAYVAAVEVDSSKVMQVPRGDGVRGLKEVRVSSRELKYVAVVHPAGGNAEEWKLPGSASGLVFSPDSSRLACTVYYVSPPDPGKGTPEFLRRCFRVVVDGREEKEYRLGIGSGEFGDPVFSPDSKHLAYRATNAGTKVFQEGFVVRDGTEGKHYEATHSLVFSPDSKQLAYVATTTPVHQGYHEAVVVDRKEGKVYEKIDGLVFSADGRHVMYRAFEHCNEPLRWRIVVDGIEGKTYEGTFWSLSRPAFFDSPDSFHYLAGPVRVDARIASK